MFSKSLKTALNTVSQQIAPDVDSETLSDATLMAEMTISSLDGHAEDQDRQELRALVAEHGYAAVLKAAAGVVATD